MIRQVSVFIQNDSGRLAHVLKALKEADVNIRSLTISETADYGIMRLILQDTDAGLKALKNAKVMANETAVAAVEIPDKPGGLGLLADLLAQEDVEIEYAYSFLPQNTSNAIIIFKVPEKDLVKVQEIVDAAPGIQLLAGDKLLMR